MANGSSFTSLSLAQRAKRGRVGTAGDAMPQSAGVIGAVDDMPTEEIPIVAHGPVPGHSAGPVSMDAAVDWDVLSKPPASPAPYSMADLDFLSSSGPLGPLRASDDDASETGEGGEGSEGSEGVALLELEAPEVPKLRPMPGASFAGLKLLASARSIPDVTGREYQDPNPSGAFASLTAREAPGNTLPERAARRDVHAIKVVTRLVRAIAFRPGSDASDRVKSEQLQQMLGDVHRAAKAVALAASPLDAHRSWVQAMCSESMADLIAAHSEHDDFDEPLNIDEAVRAITELFSASETQETVAEAVSALSDSGYVEATSEAIAADRVRASIGLASWDLYDNVLHPRLGSQSYRFTYEARPEEIVSVLLEEAVRIAKEMNIRASSLDLRTMHLQGSIRRVANLIGSEYVSRTRAIMNWLTDKTCTDEEYDRRRVEARDSLRTVVLPQVVELARRNFVAIEQIAPQLLEESKHGHVAAQRENSN